ncbi:unnamed protein product [Effrenium voratum]|uniref:Uncharacterized protein n=1 Tax=Effrenium voratum TaxID=2562239 RepID=A0AA36MNQ7_9DINO|nr:unnamed protein product [Effrenium voratum]
MASFYPFNKDGQLAGRVPASLRAGAARQESEVRKQASPPTPSQLLHRALIAKENSSEDVLRIAGERLCELDANNCATAIHKAAQFCRRAGGAAKVSRDPRLHGVMDTAVPFTDSWSSRQLCHVAWSMAVLSMGGGGSLLA